MLVSLSPYLTLALCVMQEGDPSHALYVKERQDLLDSLHRRASQLYKSLNQLEGITCNEPEGALYCMPRIRLSKKALEVCLSIVTLPLGLNQPKAHDVFVASSIAHYKAQQRARSWWSIHLQAGLR